MTFDEVLSRSRELDKLSAEAEQARERLNELDLKVKEAMGTSGRVSTTVKQTWLRAKFDQDSANRAIAQLRSRQPDILKDDDARPALTTLTKAWQREHLPLVHLVVYRSSQLMEGEFQGEVAIPTDLFGDVTAEVIIADNSTLEAARK
jgi:hypothetical protein